MNKKTDKQIKKISFLERYWPDITVYFITILLCFIAFFNIVKLTDTFDWDASHHTLYATWIANDLKTGNWLNFWEHTHHQTLWPFFHSWLLGIYFTFFGISYISARTFQLFLFFILLVSTWHVGKSLGKENQGNWIGGIAWGLLLFSANSWYWGLEVMIDLVAVLFTLFCFYCLLKLDRTKKWPWAILSGLLMGMMLVVKYNYALHIYIAFIAWLIYEFVTIILQPIPELVKVKPTLIGRIRIFKKELFSFICRIALISFFPLFTFFWWMFGPNSAKKWYMIKFSKETWVDTGQMPGFFDQLIYYLNLFITSYTWVPALGAIALVGLFGLIFLVRNKDRALILLVIFDWTGLLVLWRVLICNNRYIYSLVPLVYLSAGIFWVTVWEMIRARFGEQLAKLVAGATSIVLLVLIAAQFGPILNYFAGGTYRYDPDKRYMNVLEYIDKVVPPNAVIACGSEAGSISPYTFGFYFQYQVKNRNAPVYDKYSLQSARFTKGMYLVAFMQAPTPEAIKADQWYKFLAASSHLLKKVDEKYFTGLDLKLDIYLIK